MSACFLACFSVSHLIFFAVYFAVGCRCHQKQSIYVLRPCLNVVIVQSVWLVSWKHRWRFWFFWITLFERFYTLTQLVLILYCHITHAVSLYDKIFSQKNKFLKLCKSFVMAYIDLNLPSLSTRPQRTFSCLTNTFLLLCVMGVSSQDHQAWETTWNSGNEDYLACCRSAGDNSTCHHIAEQRTLQQMAMATRFDRGLSVVAHSNCFVYLRFVMKSQQYLYFLITFESA